ncbi:hypothetical protein LAZ67_2001518 [Cordylochernes scorpioides]|uniref:Uncharacterized protein n=1 Tax=Cordylochernes scorpioides TaxID=51811 RepID=A0ABY6K1J4_9ARAC|nr:hypothetical protein LAZ67_2001518 [Cordylochernes scorpioides]
MSEVNSLDKIAREEVGQGLISIAKQIPSYREQPRQFKAPVNPPSYHKQESPTSGASFSVISDHFRQQLKNIIFNDADMPLRVADSKSIVSKG